MASSQYWLRGAFRWAWDNTNARLALGFRRSASEGWTEQLRIASPTLAVNYLSVTNAIAGSGVSIAPVGADTDINLTIAAKGAGTLALTGVTLSDTALTGTTQASFTVDSDNVADVKTKIATNTSADGNYTLTLQPATATWTANRTLSFPDPTGSDSFVYAALAQTLTNKTMTTPTITVPTIADFTSATHDHSNAAGGGTIAAVATSSGTTSNTYDVDSDNTTGILRLQTTTGGTAHTVTLTNTTTTATRTVTLPDATDTLVGKATTDTLTNKTLTAPVINACTVTGAVTITTPTVTGTWTNLGTVTTTDINGGSVDGAIIGAASAAAGTFTTLTLGHTTPILTINAGSSNTGYVIVNGKTTGAIKILPIDAGTNTTTVSNQAGTMTITLPSATCTLPGLGLANTFSAAQAVTIDDATTNATTDVLTLSHSTTGDAAANIGAGISIKVEDSDGVTEQTTLESIVTDVGTAGATVDADVLLQSRVAGTMATVFRFDADEGGAGGAKLLQVGGDANAVSLDIHPATTASGTLRITAANSATDSVTLITNASQAAARTYTIPDGGASASFMLTQGAQTIAGVNTFTADPVVSGLLGYDTTFVITGKSGATSNGGAVTIAGGIADANNAGGAASVTGGAGFGTGTGGAATLIGGATGAGATGTGGGITVTGGAALSTVGSGGAVTVAGGVSKGAAAVTGGLISITSGAAVGAGSTAGAVTIDSGAAGSGTAGAMTIGGTNAASVAIGHASITTTVTGDLSIAAGDNISLAAGDGYIQLSGVTNGSIKIKPIDAGTGATTLQNSAGTPTITLPATTCTLPGLGLANAFTAVQTAASDDTTDGVVNILALTHSSSDNNATAADGAGISFQLENATGTSTVEEWGSMDAVSVTITNGVEYGDFVLSLMTGGNVTEAARLNSTAGALTVGRNATDANGFDTLRLYGLTSDSGYMDIQAVANTGNTALTIKNAAQGQATTLTIPDGGAATASFVLTAGAATIAGAKTFSTMPIIPTATVAAAGDAQANAAAITTGFTLVSDADATKGVKLPAAAAGLVCIVKNNANAVLKVWPNTDDAINAVAANANGVLAAFTAATYVAYDATTWYTIPLLGS